jgi:lysophospholipid acyltransferase (LPLAT)-like uncharacterized protein
VVSPLRLPCLPFDYRVSCIDEDEKSAAARPRTPRDAGPTRRVRRSRSHFEPWVLGAREQKICDRAGLSKNVPRSPVIICFWHNRILGITLTFIRRYPGIARKGVTVLTSASRDGEVLAQLVAQFGMGAVRGSSSRRGSRALREVVVQVESGRDIAITPDGPRGPRYSLGSGAISLAQLTAMPIVPMHAKFSRCFRLKSWDGFIIPLPFSKIRVTVDDSICVPRELNNEQFEAMRSRVETLLRNEAD